MSEVWIILVSEFNTFILMPFQFTQGEEKLIAISEAR